MADCEQCGSKLAGRRRTAKFCSAACRQAAWKARTGAAVRAPAAGPDMAAAVEGALTAAVCASDAAAAVDGLLTWLAETMDGLAPAARAVYGPKLAQALLAALEVRERMMSGRVTRLEVLRERAVTRELRSASAAVLAAFDVQPVALPPA